MHNINCYRELIIDEGITFTIQVLNISNNSIDTHVHFYQNLK